MILLAKEINIGKEYVLVYLSNGDEIKQQGTLHGYTDTTFAVNREGYTYVYDINNKVIFKHPKENKHSKEDIEAILEINK